MEDIKAIQTNKLAALIPEIMNAIGGGDQKTEQILAQQRAASEQNVRQANLKNFMRAVVSPQTGKIMPESITHYAELFDVRPDDAMKAISDFVRYRKSIQPPPPQPRQFSRILPSGQVNTVESTVPLTDKGWMPGTITGKPIIPKPPAPPDRIKKTWHRKDPVSGLTYTVKSYTQPGKDWQLGDVKYAPSSPKTDDPAKILLAQKKAINKEISKLKKEIYRVQSGKKQMGLMSQLILANAKKTGIGIPGLNNPNISNEDKAAQQYLAYLKQQLADKQAELSKLEASSVSSTAGDTASGTDKNGGSKSKPKRLTFSLDKGWSEE